MGDLIGWLIEAAAGPLGAAVGALVAVVAAWIAGRRSARHETKNEALRGYQETRRRLDDAARDLPDDDGVIRDWLRERGREP